jgi:hypothetical protein
MEQSQDIADTENTETIDTNEQTNQNPESDEQPSTESNSNLQDKTGAFHRIILIFILTLAFILFLSYLKTIFPSMSDYIDFIIVLLLFISIGYCFLLYYKFFRRKSSHGNLTAEQAANGWSLNSQGKLINTQGQLINTQGQLVNTQGQLINAQGQLVNAKGRLFDAQGRLINEKGQLIDEQGRLINEKGQLIDAQGRLIDEQGRLIDEQGRLIDEQGRLINEKGQLIDEQGRLINEKGQLIDDQGRAIDEQGRLIDDLGRLIDEQGRLIDEEGRLINENGQLIDAQGRPVNERGELLNPDGTVNYYECADYTGILTPAAYQSSSCNITQGGIPSSNNSSAQLQQLITGEIYLSDDERDVIFVKSSSIFNYYLLHKSKDVFESYGSPPGFNFMNKNNIFIKASVISSGPDSKKNGKKINGKGIEMLITNPGISKVTKSYFYFSKHPPLLLQGDTFTPNTAQSNIFVTSQNSFRLLSEANKVLRNYVSIDGVNFIDEMDKGNRAKLLIEPDTILPTSEQVNTRGQCIHLTNAVTEEDTYFYFSLNNSLANTSDFSSADIVNAPKATFAPASSFYQSPNQNYASAAVQVQQQTQQQSQELIATTSLEPKTIVFDSTLIDSSKTTCAFTVKPYGADTTLITITGSGNLYFKYNVNTCSFALIGGGGGGGNQANSNAGGGGGGGGLGKADMNGTLLYQVVANIGDGGGSQSNGGNTSVTFKDANGNDYGNVIAYGGGRGGPGKWSGGSGGSGGGGGSGSNSNPGPGSGKGTTYNGGVFANKHISDNSGARGQRNGNDDGAGGGGGGWNGTGKETFPAGTGGAGGAGGTPFFGEQFGGGGGGGAGRGASGGNGGNGGGKGGSPLNGNGSNGSTYGAGGGGAYNYTGVGGRGANGVVILAIKNSNFIIN